jgi:excisionase family DNA binding protein
MTQTLVTARELAAGLGVSENTIYNWSTKKKIPHLRLPDGSVRFPLEEIMQTLRVNPTEEDAA